MGKTWGRLYARTRHHRKIEILRQECPGFWQAYYVLLEMSFDCGDEGKIYVSPGQPYTEKQIAKEIGLSPKKTQILLKKLQDLELILTNSDQILFFPSYKERQYESDVSTDRVRKHREKQKEQETMKRRRNVSETDQNRNRTETEQKQNNITPYPLKRGNSFSPQNLAELWNQKAPPEMARVNLPFKRAPKAMEKIRDAIKRNPDVQWWDGVIQRMYQSPFLRGEKGWKANIDFMVKKAEEIVDGKYDGGRVVPQAGITAWLLENDDEREGIPDGI